MKFVDESTIEVTAGRGGDGKCGFRREKFIPFGGPDGGDGGDGGSIFLVGNIGLNTLVDYRHRRIFRAESGATGGGANCTGKSGENLSIPVPIGTLVYDVDTDELIGEVLEHGQQLLVAQGGFHGLGNARFKSSVNRAPRQTSKGSLGEHRWLRLELKVLADVGLLGFPNAGKSTLIRAVSAAKPKVADYPFTTLHPNLGVVKIGEQRSFVIADIPGLVEGAAEGAGLGIQFLKHLARTGLLLHIVDVNPIDETDPVKNIAIIQEECAKYGGELTDKETWLVLNKVDILLPEERAAHCKAIVKKSRWKGPVYQICALSGEGTQQLCQDIMQHIEQQRPVVSNDIETHSQQLDSDTNEQ